MRGTSLAPEPGVRPFGGDWPACSTRCPHPASHSPPPSPVRIHPFLCTGPWAHPLTWATWRQGCPSQLHHNTHLVTLGACHLFLSLGFVVSKMNMMPVWQDHMCTGLPQRPPGRMNRGEEELCRARRGPGAQVQVWEERTVGAQMLRGGAAVTALPCAGLVPGRMKGRASALLKAPLSSWRTAGDNVLLPEPLTKARLASVYLSLYFNSTNAFLARKKKC